MTRHEYPFPHDRWRGHARTPPEGTPTRPRDAASLILVRRAGREPEVLMGKRHRKAAFVPDAYVFPGGRVDRADARIDPATPLDPGMARHLAVGGRQPRARALAAAAVRETFEETGLLLGRPGDVGAAAQAADGANDTTWTEIREMGLAPDLARLDYIGRAITSPYSRIRFHARFFVADADHVTGELGGSGELSDLHWVPLGEAVRLPIVDVTEFMLEEVGRLLAGRPRHPGRKPLFAYRADAPFARYL